MTLTSAAKRRAWSLGRVSLAGAVLALMARGGHIEWSRLKGVLDHWPLSLLALALLLLGLAIASWRFCLLTAARGFQVTFANSLRLTLIGNAANIVVPTIGGDLLRVWFAADGHPGRRTEIATICLLDRVLGLIGLLLVPVTLAPFFPGIVRESRVILYILVVAAGGAVALAAAILVALSPRGSTSTPVRFLLRTFPLGGYPQRIIDTVHSYREHPASLAAGAAWSIASNLCMAVSLVVLQLPTTPWEGAMLGGYLASLTFVLNNVPITPSGIGVTEAAVAALYAMAGMHGGAETMLQMRLLLVALAPVGVMFYLRGMRRYLTAAHPEAATPQRRVPA